jgi:hypothetical protein
VRRADLLPTILWPASAPISPLENDMKELSSPTVGLGLQLTEMHTLEKNISAFIDVYDAADGDREGASAVRALAELDRMTPAINALCGVLEPLGHRALRTEMARELTLIIASKPEEWNRATSEPGDTRSSLREMWTQLFIEEVEALTPSVGGLRLAGQRLRHSRSDNDYANRRLPPICDVVQAVRDAEARFRRVRRRLSDLPALRARLQQAVDYEAARQARYQQSARLANPATNSTEE